MGKHWCIECGYSYSGRDCPRCHPQDTERNFSTQRAEFRHNTGMDEEEKKTWLQKQRCPECKEFMEFIERRGITYAICRKCKIEI